MYRQGEDNDEPVTAARIIDSHGDSKVQYVHSMKGGTYMNGKPAGLNAKAASLVAPSTDMMAERGFCVG